MIRVACAIILKNGRVLAAQRSMTMDQPGKWEFPGGKIESNEHPYEAISREILEELSIEICPRALLPSIVHCYPSKTIELIPILASPGSGNIKLLEHSEVRWLLPEELPDLEWAAADQHLVDLFKSKPSLIDGR